MRVLLTGASGLLGRALVRPFEESHELYATDGLKIRSLKNPGPSVFICGSFSRSSPFGCLPRKTRI